MPAPLFDEVLARGRQKKILRRFNQQEMANVARVAPYYRHINYVLTDKIINQCTTALERKQSDYMYYLRAKAYLKLKSFDNAMEDALAALNLNPDCAEAQQILHLACCKRRCDSPVEEFVKPSITPEDIDIVFEKAAERQDALQSDDGPAEEK